MGLYLSYAVSFHFIIRNLYTIDVVFCYCFFFKCDFISFAKSMREFILSVTRVLPRNTTIAIRSVWTRCEWNRSATSTFRFLAIA